MVARRNTEITDAAGDAWNTLVALVRQLQDYRESLYPDRRDLRRDSRAAAEQPAHHRCCCASTARRRRRQHLHTGAVGAATVELADLKTNLAARLATLRQSLTATTNGLVLRAP